MQLKTNQFCNIHNNFIFKLILKVEDQVMFILLFSVMVFFILITFFLKSVKEYSHHIFNKIVYFSKLFRDQGQYSSSLFLRMLS